jgi:aspartate beta-hydroxylase
MSSDLQALARAGAEALRAGDAPRARSLFEQIVASGRSDSSVWLGLAVASRAMHDGVATLEALDRVLALQPHNLRALIMKADHLAEAGDTRAATAFYVAALKAAPPAAQLPQEAQTELRRVQAIVERYSSALDAHLRRRLQERNLTPAASGGRFAQSLDILTGRKRIYFQEPLYYFFPELPQVQFYDRQQFGWLDKVEAATDDIRSELLEVLRDEEAFVPYVQANANRPTEKSDRMLNNASWSAFFLCKDGAMVS